MSRSCTQNPRHGARKCKHVMFSSVVVTAFVWWAGYNLLNRQYNVTFAWESIPIVGAMHAGRTDFAGWRMPGEYIKATKAMMGGYHR
jgi:hypothetical protein